MPGGAIIDLCDGQEYNKHMVTIAVPKKIVHKREDLIILPRLEYEALLKRKGIREVKLTVGERRAVKESEKELAKGWFAKVLKYEPGNKDAKRFLEEIDRYGK